MAKSIVTPKAWENRIGRRLRLRDLHILSASDQDLIAFSRRFGDLDWAPIQD